MGWMNVLRPLGVPLLFLVTAVLSILGAIIMLPFGLLMLILSWITPNP